MSHYNSNSEKEIPYGYCHCGCGKKTDLATHTFSKRGIKKNEPNLYYGNHHSRPTLEERFWKKVDKSDGEDACWIWTGNKYPSGYGSIRYNGNMEGTHRISYMLEYGEVPDNLCVLHKCDNSPCVNPKHLWLGTKQDNSDDKFAKGRFVPANGERNGNHIYTDIQITEIRRLRKEENLKSKEIAKIFGATVGHINKILRNAIRKE